MNVNEIIMSLFFITLVVCFFVSYQKEIRHLEEEKVILKNKKKVCDEILAYQWQEALEFADSFHEVSLQLLEESGYSLDKNGIVIIPGNPTNENKLR